MATNITLCSTTQITPIEALRRLVDIARLIDADECPELYNQLQGELTVAGAVLAEADPVIPEMVDGEPIDFNKITGSVAFHLIERHGEDWSDCGRLMEEFAAARIAASIPKNALTDEQIKKIASENGMSTYGYQNDPFSYCIDFARAIEAASGPNAALVEALKDIIEDVKERHDMNDPSTNPGIKNCVERGIAALAAAGVKEAP